MKESAYKKAGVDIEAGAELVNRIKPHVKSTMRSGVVSDIGGFGALFDLKKTNFRDPILVSSTDGVGTKIKVAIDTQRHSTIGIDAVAMCVNDIIVQGAEPLFFLDYFATGRLDNDVAEAVIAGVAEGCRQAGCALIGGETAEMPGLYAENDYDLAGFSVGAVERDRIVDGSRIAEGDIILGLASNGLHSNGFSLVRSLIKSSGARYEGPAPFEPDVSLGEALLAPTRIYVKSLLEALKITDNRGHQAIKGMAHITGGGLYENIPRIMPDDLTARIDAATWEIQPVFRWLMKTGDIEAADMARTLNCGIGMAVVCAPDYADRIAETLKNAGETVYTIGAMEKRKISSIAVALENAGKLWSGA